MKRKIAAGEATQDELDQVLYDPWEHFSELDKRGSTRTSKLCKNKPGKNRKTVSSSLKSSSYRNVKYLIQNSAKKVYYADRKACGGNALNVGGALVSGYKFVTEHVWELQGVKTFFQSMVDGVGPGNTPLSTGALSWTPFDQTAPATASFFNTWANSGVPFSGAGSTPMDSFYNVLGTLTDTNNNLILDSQTNGMKAIIWYVSRILMYSFDRCTKVSRQGGKDLVAADTWKAASHLVRLGLLNRIKAAFDYMNNADAQAAFQYVYDNTLTASTSFQQVLANQGITYDVPTAFRQYTAAQFSYMGTNAQSWVANSANLAQEVAYWGSTAARTAFTANVAKANQLAVQTLMGNIGTWAQVAAPK